MTANNNTDRINAFGNLSARGFNFFYPTRIAPFGRIWERSDQQPPHIAAHFQAHTGQRSIQRLVKELQFCPHTLSFLCIFELYRKT
jgi:hypothetical protein